MENTVIVGNQSDVEVTRKEFLEELRESVMEVKEMRRKGIHGKNWRELFKETS